MPQPSTGSDYARQTPGHLSCLDLGLVQNAGPTKSASLWSTREPEPEWLRPRECIQPRESIDSSQQSNLEPEQCRPEITHAMSVGKTQCGPDTVSNPHTSQ